MARIRSISPDLATDPKLCAVSLAASALAKESWPWHDDHGHISYEAERIRLCVWPSRQVDVAELLKELIKVGWFEVYELPGGRQFLFCTEFGTYQKVPHPSAPKFERRGAKKLSSEAPKAAVLMSPHEPSRALNVDGREGGDGRDGMSEGMEKAKANGKDPLPRARPVAPPSDPATPRSFASLPREVQDFARRFYGKATPERKQQIRATLLASLTSGGAKLNKRDSVRAGSVERLARKCSEVLQEGVHDPDKAVVVLLKKLGDATDASPTEKAVTETAQVQVQDRIALARQRAIAERFEAEHPERAAKIREQLERVHPVDGKTGSLMHAVGEEALRAALISALCAAAAEEHTEPLTAVGSE